MRLDVLIDGHVAGNLDLTDHDSPSFRYTDEYLRRAAPTPLSTRIPVAAGSVNGPWLAGWLKGLLPDNSRVRDSWCEDNGVDERYPLRLLGTPVGVDCAGAVQFCPPAATESLIATRGALDPLTDDAAHDWLLRLRADPAYRPRRWVADVGWSLSGMQPKVAWRLVEGRWAVARGREPTSHVLKVTRIDYAHEALIEHLTMRTAARLGIPAADTSIIEWDDVEAIAVRRYDRARTGPTSPLIRLHQEDLCQAAGFAPDQKYQRHGGPNLAACAAVIRDPVDPSASGDIQRFRDMLLYHWIIVNPDAHAKNYSLLLRGRERRLAPLYDSSTWLPYRYGDEVTNLPLAMYPGADRHLKALDTPQALAGLAGALGVSTLETAERAEDLAARLPAAIEATINKAPDHHQDVPEVVIFATELPERAQHCAAVATEVRRIAARPARPPEISDLPRFGP